MKYVVKLLIYQVLCFEKIWTFIKYTIVHIVTLTIVYANWTVRNNPSMTLAQKIFSLLCLFFIF